MYNGFKTKFNGAFSVGAMLTIPIWHWGGNYNKYRSAKVDETIMKLQIEDAKSTLAEFSLTSTVKRSLFVATPSFIIA